VREYVHLSLQRIRWLGEHGEVVKPSNKKQRGSGSNASRGKPSASPNSAEGAAVRGKTHTHQPAFKRSACPATVLTRVDTTPRETAPAGISVSGGRMRAQTFLLQNDAAGLVPRNRKSDFLLPSRRRDTRALE
jgi:hypothetical protein